FGALGRDLAAAEPERLEALQPEMRVLLLNLRQSNRLLDRCEHEIDIVDVGEQQCRLPGRREARCLASVENLAYAIETERAGEAWKHERPLQVRECRVPRIENALRARLRRLHDHLRLSGRAGGEEDDVAVAARQRRRTRLGVTGGVHPG